MRPIGLGVVVLVIQLVNGGMTAFASADPRHGWVVLITGYSITAVWAEWVSELSCVCKMLHHIKLLNSLLRGCGSGLMT